MLFRSPRFEDKIEPKELSFSFHEKDAERIDAYEKVLFDCISGDQTSFISTEEILHTWEYITSLKNMISQTPLHEYSRGTDPGDVKKLSENNLEVI